MYTLIIIDMQKHFHVSDTDAVTAGVRREILRALEDKAHIICVEYANYGKTLSVLYDLFKDYPQGYVIEKASISGSREILSFLEGKNFPMHFRFTGVNTNACVAGTLRGLHKSLKELNTEFKIDVIADACASMDFEGIPDQMLHDGALASFREMSNVTVVMTSEK